VGCVTPDPTLGEATSRPDTSHFNGLQTTGRDYRNLSPAEHIMARDVDQAVPLRNGGRLLADVYRPVGQGRARAHHEGALPGAPMG